MNYEEGFGGWGAGGLGVGGWGLGATKWKTWAETFCVPLQERVKRLVA